MVNLSRKSLKYKSKSVRFEANYSYTASIKKWILSGSSYKDCVKGFWENLSEYHFVGGFSLALKQKDEGSRTSANFRGLYRR